MENLKLGIGHNFVQTKDEVAMSVSCDIAMAPLRFHPDGPNLESKGMREDVRVMARPRGK